MGVRDQKRKQDLAKKRMIRENSKNNSKSYDYQYLLTIAYDGYEFGGYAKQKHKNTIQNNLESALETVLKEHVKTVESSRTDAKVHALCQKVMFKYYTDLNLNKTLFSLNTLLPKAIRIIGMEKVSADFHCRYHVKNKTYVYKISKSYSPFKRFYEYYHFNKLDVALMKKAAKYFVGEHDFSAFCSSKSTQESKVREIYRIDVIDNDETIEISVCGSGFLYNMVRIIVGTLIEVGEYKIKVKDIKTIIESLDRQKAGATAPAHGLYLTEIKY